MTKTVNLELLLYEALHSNIHIGFGMLGSVVPNPNEIKLTFNF